MIEHYFNENLIRGRIRFNYCLDQLELYDKDTGQTISSVTAETLTMCEPIPALCFLLYGAPDPKLGRGKIWVEEDDIR